MSCEVDVPADDIDLVLEVAEAPAVEQVLAVLTQVLGGCCEDCQQLVKVSNIDALVLTALEVVTQSLFGKTWAIDLLHRYASDVCKRRHIGVL